MGTGYDPLLLVSDFHESQLLDLVGLCVVDADSCPGSVNSKGCTDEISSGLSLDVLGFPHSVNGAYGKVGIND